MDIEWLILVLSGTAALTGVIGIVQRNEQIRLSRKRHKWQKKHARKK